MKNDEALKAWKKYRKEASYDEHYNDLQEYGIEIEAALTAQSPAEDDLEKVRQTLQDVNDAMDYMSEYDIPIALPDHVKQALSIIEKIMGDKS